MSRMRPPPLLTVSQWADQYRHLSPESSAEPGRWDTARAEYQREMMDATCDPSVELVAVMKSSQVGWTEIINNIVGYHIHQDPAPILVVQPTVEMGEAWSKDRLAPMLRDTPALRGQVGEAKARSGSNTLRYKSFPGGHLTIAGANSPASLASRPIRVILFDEVDRYPASAGREGDPVTLGRKRTTTFWNRRIVLGGSPTLRGHSRTEAAYEASDQRRFWVPCTHCGHRQKLGWTNVVWTGEDPSTARYHCEACGAGWTDAQRWAAVRFGRWIASKPFTGTAGFHISELYSPWRKLSETVGDFLAAKKGGVELMKAWVNTALGETWQEQGEAPEWERLLERREATAMGIVPAWAVVLTAGIDNQASPARLEYAVWAWGPGYESALIDTGAIAGDPASDTVWDEIAALLARDWPREGGGTIRIAKAGVDTGGQHTQGVYAQLRRLRDLRTIMPLKGVPGWNKASPVAGPTPVDITAGGRKIKRGLLLWTVSVDVLKSELYRRLWLTPTADGSLPDGWVHLPEGMDVEQVKQLVAEQLVTVKDRRGFARYEWEKLRANEQLDMAVYARAALSLLGSDRYGARFWVGRAKALDQPDTKPSRAIAAPTASPTPAPALLPPPAPPARTGRWRS